MSDLVPRSSRIATGVGLALLAATASAQIDPTVSASRPSSRELMWPAPTGEDWKRPVLVRFQRTWEDAVALSKETKRPILVCVNMDGEIASEHYAGIRYRQPEIAKLYEPYVCVIASVYRHTPRDFDENGNRILCPRFGSCTCGEHIAIEPLLFEKFMDGRRIAPRHIMVELDGQETYDVFYAFDTASVFQAIETGITKRATQPLSVVRSDRPILERVASPDNADQSAVEKAFLEGNSGLRRQLLEAAAARGEAVPVDLLRLAIFGTDPELAQLARGALARASAEGAVDLISEALRVPMQADERAALVAALERLGQRSPRARTLAVVHQGLGSRSTTVDVDGWKQALGAAPTYVPAPERSEIEARIEGRTRAALANPTDAAARLELAESHLALALDAQAVQGFGANRKAARQHRILMFQDAQRAAQEAQKLGAVGWRVDAVLAIAAQRLGDQDEADRRAEAAVGAMAPDATNATSALVLQIFAEARQRAISKAVVAKQKWPPQWLTDVHAAYSVLGKHPLGTDVNVVSHYDFMKFLGGETQANRVLDEGLARFPASWNLHDRLRERILAEKGVENLEHAYAAHLKALGTTPNPEWFEGYTSIVAAEFQRRAGKDEAALAAYDRAIARYDESVARHPESKESSDHYAALALAGKARLALERRELERALAELLASFARHAAAAAVQDGLNLSPVDTAKMLLARLRQAQRFDLSKQLEDALGRLDPEQLALPAYEREVPRPGSRRGG